MDPMGNTRLACRMPLTLDSSNPNGTFQQFWDHIVDIQRPPEVRFGKGRPKTYQSNTKLTSGDIFKDVLGIQFLFQSSPFYNDLQGILSGWNQSPQGPAMSKTSAFNVLKVLSLWAMGVFP